MEAEAIDTLESKNVQNKKDQINILYKDWAFELIGGKERDGDGNIVQGGENRLKKAIKFLYKEKLIYDKMNDFPWLDLFIYPNLSFFQDTYTSTIESSTSLKLKTKPVSAIMCLDVMEGALLMAKTDLEAEIDTLDKDIVFSKAVKENTIKMLDEEVEKEGLTLDEEELQLITNKLKSIQILKAFFEQQDEQNCKKIKSIYIDYLYSVQTSSNAFVSKLVQEKTLLEWVHEKEILFNAYRTLNDILVNPDYQLTEDEFNKMKNMFSQRELFEPFPMVLLFSETGALYTNTLYVFNSSDLSDSERKIAEFYWRKVYNIVSKYTSREQRKEEKLNALLANKINEDEKLVEKIEQLSL